MVSPRKENRWARKLAIMSNSSEVLGALTTPSGPGF